MNRGLNLFILMFSLLVLLQTASGYWLHFLNYGDLEQTRSFIFGDQERVEASLTRLLKTAVPHILAVSILTMIVAHFLAFSGPPRTSRILLAMSLPILATFNAVAGPVVKILGPEFATLKLVTFWCFQLAWVLAQFWILKSALSALQTGASTQSKKA